MKCLNEIMKKTKIIAGIDEAGRGPWAGPVVAAAVILPHRFPTALLKDSKKLSSTQREKVYTLITQKCEYGIGIVDQTTIDEIGIKKATQQAMYQAVQQLTTKPTELLVDGNDQFSFPIQHTSIIKGDEKIPSISAASIIAKVTRDRLMREEHKKYPHYRFDLHKGYGTRLHRDMLQQYGVCPLHRKSYKPVAEILNKQKPKLLLHICCAVDAGWPILKLKDTYAITCYFYDPNIHPKKEYIKRRNEMKKIIRKFKTIDFIEGPYEPDLFFKRTKGLEWEPERGKRCDVCTHLLLEKTAQYAQQNGFDYFTTTLSTSPHKDIVRIQKYGKFWEKETGVTYLDENFKKENGYLKTLAIVQELHIYQQNYCGCIFSLRDRKRKETGKALQKLL